jgi:ATP-binding cassette subfamily B protein
MLRNTRDEVFIFVSHIFNNILYLAIDLTLVFVFLIFLILFGNFYSLIIILFFLALAKIFYQSLKKTIHVYGNRRSEIAEKVYKYLKEGFSSFKEIKIYNKKIFFVNRYEIEWKKNISMSVIINLIEILPKVIFEIIAVFLFLLIINFFIKTQQDFSEFIPILSVYILSIYRILPGIIRFLRNFQKIKHYMPAFYNISNAHNEKIDPLDTLEITHNKILKFKFKKIELKNIFFKYEKRKILFQNLNLSILKQSKTLINGKSGCGKSTLLDIICGLSNPTSGEVLINGKIATLLDKKLLLHNISYVSQSSFFIDNSLFLNIAFAEEKNTDLKKILNLLKLVELNEFFDKLKTGIDVPIGEAASQLSGGEKQRVAIARALYFNPKILILDEATNAIDFYTERKILENIRKKIKNITIIKVSHATHDYGNLFLKYKLENKKLTKANF